VHGRQKPWKRASSLRLSVSTPAAVASPPSICALPTLLNHFVQARVSGTYERLLKRLAKIAVPMIDNFGLPSMSDREERMIKPAKSSAQACGCWESKHKILQGGRTVIADKAA
jgi:hypothetical protein